MKKNSLLILATLISTLLCTCVSYADTKEFVFHRTQMPNRLFYLKRGTNIGKNHISPTFTEFLKNEDAKYWMQNKYQNDYDIQKIDIVRSEKAVTSEKIDPFYNINHISASHAQMFGGYTKVTWVFFKMTYTPKKIISISNTVINSNSNTNTNANINVV